MTPQQVAEKLHDPALERDITEALKSWPDADPRDVERTARWMLGLRDDLVSLVRTIDDPDEIVTTLAINYIELKTRWIAINTKVNYQTFRTGSCESVAAMRGTAISMLLGAVEALVSEADIEKITDFLSQPVRRAA
jgi:hypothetical protein